MIHVYTGNGKGKTTAAAGLALRAAGGGKKVVWVQFLRGPRPSGEIKLMKKLPRVAVFQFGSKNWLHRGGVREEDRREARRAWRAAEEIIRKKSADLLVLNEINIALYLRLLPSGPLLEELKRRRRALEIVLTGRRAPPALIRLADYVTEMKEIKHPYRRGAAARGGIEF